MLRLLLKKIGITGRKRSVTSGDTRDVESIISTDRTAVVMQTETSDARKKPSTHPGSLFDVPVVRAIEFHNWQPDYYEYKAEKIESLASAFSELNQDEAHFLVKIKENPGRKSSDYAKVAGISSARALKYRRRLVELGYLLENNFNENGRGRASIFLVPTKKALDAGNVQEDNSR